MTLPPDFDLRLDEHQERLAEMAAAAEARSYEAAARPGADPVETTFGELRPGDFMTNEGPAGRWVEVVEVRGPCCYVRSRRTATPDGMVGVLFRIPEAVSVSGETRYWIDRRRDEPVLVDGRGR